MTRTIAGKVVQVLIAPDPETMRAIVQESVTVTFEGFVGDRHAGLTMLSGGRQPHYPRRTEIRNTRQVSIVSVEELATVATTLGVEKVTPEALGANLLIAGIPRLTQLPPGTRLFFPGEAVLVVEAENGPCTLAGAEVQADHPTVPGLTSEFPKAAHKLRGLVAWVERPGSIAVGDEVKVLVPDFKPYE